MLTGGGTGGHITPLLAVARELKRLEPGVHITYIGERGSQFASMTTGNSDIDEVRTVHAGKFRRYHGESWLRRLFDIKTNLLNVRDLFYFIIGTLQSVVLVRRLQPDSVLLKGGFVGVPVGLACALWRYPFVTHDSDAVSGLANRLVARWARYHATGLPAEYYTYPPQDTRHVGVLVSRDHTAVTAKAQTAYKKRVGVPEDAMLLLVTGGSSGAASINHAIRSIIEDLLKSHKNLYVVHQTGRGKAAMYSDFSHERLRVEELLFPLYEFTGASDLVVSRAGANTLAELGVQGRACVIIPNPHLTGGHQIKNAKYFEGQGAIRVVNDTTIRDDPGELGKVITELLADSEQRHLLGSRLQGATIPDATNKLTMLLLEVAKNS